MPNAHVLRATTSTADESCPGTERARRNPPLTANAQAWRRLAREGYGRTAERVRASQGTAPHGADQSAPR